METLGETCPIPTPFRMDCSRMQFLKSLARLVGQRRVRSLFWSQPRKAGKTFLEFYPFLHIVEVNKCCCSAENGLKSKSLLAEITFQKHNSSWTWFFAKSEKKEIENIDFSSFSQHLCKYCSQGSRIFSATDFLLSAASAIGSGMLFADSTWQWIYAYFCFLQKILLVIISAGAHGFSMSGYEIVNRIKFLTRLFCSVSSFSWPKYFFW